MTTPEKNRDQAIPKEVLLSPDVLPSIAFLEEVIPESERIVWGDETNAIKWAWIGTTKDGTKIEIHQYNGESTAFIITDKDGREEQWMLGEEDGLDDFIFNLVSITFVPKLGSKTYKIDAANNEEECPIVFFNLKRETSRSLPLRVSDIIGVRLDSSSDVNPKFRDEIEPLLGLKRLILEAVNQSSAIGIPDTEKRVSLG